MIAELDDPEEIAAILRDPGKFLEELKTAGGPAAKKMALHGMKMERSSRRSRTIMPS